MKHQLLACALLLSLLACTPDTPQAQCPAGQIPLEFGKGCCDDANANGVCDAYEEEANLPIETPVANTTVRGPPAVTMNGTAANDTPRNTTPPDTRSLTERYEDTFREKARSYSYYTGSPYGWIWVWIQPGKTIYIPVQQLFENDRGTVKKGSYAYDTRGDTFIWDIQDRHLHVMNYLVWSEATGKYDGCYVRQTYYKMENCIEDYPNGNPIIHYRLAFTPPKGPLEWLVQYDGETPTELQESVRINTPEGKQILVDEVTFANDDGTMTRLYVHAIYKAPIRVDILESDGKLRQRIDYNAPAFNTLDTHEGAPRLENQYTY